MHNRILKTANDPFHASKRKITSRSVDLMRKPANVVRDDQSLAN